MSVRNGQDRLRAIADTINSGQLPSEKDLEFIAKAFQKIADGEDAKQALNVKAKRGERTSKASSILKDQSRKRKDFGLLWLATATSPLAQGGLGLKLNKAFEKLRDCNGGSMFQFTEETLQTYWNDNPERRKSITLTLHD